MIESILTDQGCASVNTEMSGNSSINGHAQEIKSDGKIPLAISIDEKGLVKAKDNSELLRYCGALVTSKMVPARFGTAQELFGALMYVRSLGLQDIAIRQVAVIEGTPSIFGDLPLALVQKSGLLTSFKEVWFNKQFKTINFENGNLDDEIYGATCFCARLSGEVQSFSFTMKDAEMADLYPPKKWDKESRKMIPNLKSPWSKHTRLMLRYKARAIGLKSLFADAISGVAIAEYDFEQIDPELKDVTNSVRKENLDAEMSDKLKTLAAQ